MLGSVKDIDIKKELSIKFIAYLEIFGGVLGVVMAIIVFFVTLHKAIFIQHASWLMVSQLLCVPLLFLFLFIFTLRAGMMLNKSITKGYWDSMWVQGWQLFVILTPSFTYQFVAGLQLLPGYVSSPSIKGFYFLSHLIAKAGAQAGSFFVGSHYVLQFKAPASAPAGMYGVFINLVPLLCLILLYVYRPKQK